MEFDEVQKKITPFDMNEYVENNIAPLLEEARHKCQIMKIPMFATVCGRNDENGSDYVTRGVFPDSSGLRLKDDRFVDLLLIMNGCIAVYAPECEDGDPFITQDNSPLPF